VIESENVPASLEMAETRCPGEQRAAKILFGGRSVLAVLQNLAAVFAITKSTFGE
jgi:hypothetical protein